MNSELIKSLQHGAEVFGQIIFAAFIVIVFLGGSFCIAWGILSLGSFLAIKFSGWVAIPVCFIIIAFLIAIGSAVNKYFSERKQ
jgi:hypothetical protein